MSKHVHGGSLFLGAVLGAGVVAAMGAVGEHERAVERFEIEAVGTGTGSYHAFVLDTSTGQVWEQNQANFHGPKLGP